MNKQLDEVEIITRRKTGAQCKTKQVIITMRCIFRTISKIHKGVFPKIVNGFQSLTIFTRKLYHRLLIGSLIRLRQLLLISNTEWIMQNESFQTWESDLPNLQKQPPEVFYKKRCSQKFHKIHRKTPASESFF